jgi:uncharacterized protein YndB with AHSA1/START domain
MKPIVHSSLRNGEVRVSVLLAASPQIAWQHLTDKTAVSRWFGDLSNTLTAGGIGRLDFGDGDFFVLTNVRMEPQSKLAYEWRFLGTGPVNTIEWEMKAQSNGTLVTVMDQEHMRSDEVIKELQDGWTDFLQRLSDHIATGDVTRYDCRRDFDGQIELDAPFREASRSLIGADAELSWGPFCKCVIAEGAIVRISDAPGEIYQVSALNRRTSSVSFLSWNEGWLTATHCRIEVAARGALSMLSVHHTGWDKISADPSVCIKSRRQFGEQWIQALDRAKQQLIAG